MPPERSKLSQFMNNQKLLVLLVVAWATGLRVGGVAWDGYTYQHPDERFLLMEALKLEAPASLGEALDPWRTPANPNNRGTTFYVYGALPPQLIRAVAAPFGLAHLGEILPAARFLTIFVDLVGMVLLMRLARRLAGARGELVTGALYGSTPLLVQQARFATVDVWGTTLVVAAAWEVVGRPVTLARVTRAGIWVGLAAACKPNLVLAVLVPLAALVVFAGQRRQAAGRTVAWALAAAMALGAAALLAIKVADPGLFNGVLSLHPNPRRLAALQQLAYLFAGNGQYPPNLQWADRLPVLEPLASLLVWGTGPLLGMAVLLGLGRAAARTLLGEVRWWPMLAFLVPGVAWPLSRFVCSVRHLEPVLPFAVLAAGWWLVRQRAWMRVVVVGGTMVWGLGWASIGWREHTRVEASRWLQANLPAGAKVTHEYWDDPLPVGRSHGLLQLSMRVFDPDTPAKREAMLAALELADAVVLASQRGVGSICRVPDAYPLTSEYYHLLFSGALGFRQAASFTRRLGPLSDLRAEESLSVYDHPPVWVFTKTADYSPELARALLERVPLPASTRWHTGELKARGTPPYLERWQEKGSLPGLLGGSVLEMVAALLLWVAAIEVLALGASGVLRRLVRGAPDASWGVSRWFGITAFGMGWLWCGWAGVPGWNRWLPGLVLVLAIPWAANEARRVWRQSGWWTSAALVWAVFGLFLALRLANPEIDAGEKPMNSALLHGVLRSERLPPVDPSFAGSPRNDSFFGVLPHAFLARAVGIAPPVAYNLIAATVPALTAGAAASLGWLLAGRRAGAVLAVVATQLAGNAAALFRIPELVLNPSLSGFSAASRVIPDTINEFPLWTALSGDLHAAFLAFPGFLAATWAISLVATRRLRGWAAAVLVGGAGGVQAMSNTWEVLGLAVMAALASLGLLAGARDRLLVIRLRLLVGAMAVAVVVSSPWWLAWRPATGGVRWTSGSPIQPAQLAELFGPAGALLLVAVGATLLGAPREGHPRWGWLLVAGGLVAIAVPEVVTVGDRMTTVFKLHLQAHLLLGASLGGVVGGLLGGLHGWRKGLVATGVALSLGCGLLTTYGCTASLLSVRPVVGPRPTLDGGAYLASLAPEQREVLAALAALPYGATVYEPGEPPDSESLRVPTFTGLPVPVGERHVFGQSRHSLAEIALRLRDGEELAVGDNPAVVRALTRRYRITAALAWAGERPALVGQPGWEEMLRSGAATVWKASLPGGER